MSREFAGWVPTVTGHLSFSLIGLSTGLSSCVTANSLCVESAARGAAKRYIGVAAKRITTDFPYNGWPMGWLFPSTKAEYVLIGSTAPAKTPVWRADELDTAGDDIGELEGTIYVVPSHPTKPARHAANKLVKQIRELFSDYAARAPRGALCEISDMPLRLKELIEKAKVHHVRTLSAHFILYRTGEFRLTVDPDAWRKVLEYKDEAEAKRFVDLLASQIFYFGKDAAHRHYHHRNTSDNLLPLIEVVNGDDTAWRRDTLWALVRAVLEARRRNNLQGYKSALGILAYAEAFQALLAQIRRVDRQTFVQWKEATHYDFRHTRASLEATIGEREYTDTSGATFKSVILASGFASAALWVAAVQAIPTVCPAFKVSSSQCIVPPGWAAVLLRHLVLNPSDGFWALLLLGLLWYGGKLRTLPITTWIVEGLDSWGQALGATLARWWRPRLLGYSDRVATISSALLVLIFGMLFLTLVAAMFGLF